MVAGVTLMEVKNVVEELSRHPEGTFLDLVEFNGNSFGAFSITGVSPVWEMHPDTDEFFHVLEGETRFILLEESGEQEYVALAGSVFVVPKGIWHKPGAPQGAKIFYFTPGQSLHSHAADPRQSDV